MAPKPKAQRRRTLPEQDTLTQMMRKARGKISSPPPPPDRKTFAQFLEDSFAGNLLDNDFTNSFTQGLREATNRLATGYSRCSKSFSGLLALHVAR
jgi:hypothetical protein